MKSADTLDLGCVTIVRLFPAGSRQVNFKSKIECASMAELADAPDLGSGGEIHAGSIPVTRTNEKSPKIGDFIVLPVLSQALCQ